MNNITHDHLNQLRIIAQLRPGQRLDTTNGVTVYKDTWANWIMRKWYNDSKNEGTRYLQDLYKSIDQNVDQLIIQLDKKQNTRKISIAHTLIEKIYESIKGIENLSKTYKYFPKTYAILEGIVQDYAIEIYKRLIELTNYSDAKTVTYNGKILYNGIDEEDII